MGPQKENAPTHACMGENAYVLKRKTGCLQIGKSISALTALLLTMVVGINIKAIHCNSNGTCARQPAHATDLLRCPSALTKGFAHPCLHQRSQFSVHKMEIETHISCRLLPSCADIDQVLQGMALEQYLTWLLARPA